MLGYGEMQDEHRPPREIWLDDEALDDHFQNLKARLRSGASQDDGWEDIPSEQNELTRGLRRGS